MLVEYVESEEAHSTYPSRSDVAKSYAGYVGETDYTWATVVESNDKTFIAEQGNLTLTVPQQTERASHGDVVMIKRSSNHIIEWTRPLLLSWKHNQGCTCHSRRDWLRPLPSGSFRTNPNRHSDGFVPIK